MRLIQTSIHARNCKLRDINCVALIRKKQLGLFSDRWRRSREKLSQLAVSEKGVKQRKRKRKIYLSSRVDDGIGGVT